MAIQYVGGQLQSITASTTTATTINFSLTGGLASAPAADDIVIVSFGVGATVNSTIGVNTAGYTEVAELYANDSYDANLSVSWKIMGSTPDTSVVVSATGLNSDGGYVVIQVFRGVNATTPLDVTPTTATGGNSGIPNPAAITPTSANTDIVVVGATASTGGNTFTASYLSNFLTASNTAATNDITIGAGWVTGPAGGVSYDPAAFSVTGSANTQSWATVTMALREQPTVITGAALIEPGVTTVATGQLVALGSATATPEVSIVANSEVIPFLATGYGWSLYGARPYGVDISYVDAAATISPAATATAAGNRVALGAAAVLPAAATVAAGTRIALGAAAILPAASTVAAAVRLAPGASALISPAATTAAAGQRLGLGAAIIAPASTMVAAAQRIGLGSVTASPAAATSAAAQRIGQGAAVIAPAASLTATGGLRISGASAIMPSASTSAFGLRVAQGDAAASPALAATAASTVIFTSSASIVIASDTSAVAALVYSAAAVGGATCSIVAAGRFFWEPEGPQAEIWTEQADQAEAWAQQTAQSEIWVTQAANDETWAPATAGSKTWAQAV